MTAGKLAAAKPAAVTNTSLYSCPINKATSSILEVCNQSSTSSSYRVALRDYDQILTLDSSTYNFRRGNVISDYTLTLSPGIATNQADPGDIIQISDNKGSFKYHDVFKPSETITYPVKVSKISSIAVDQTSLVGTFAVGNTITGASSGLTATVFATDITGFTANIPSVAIGATSFRVSDSTGITASDLICANQEIISVSTISGYQVTTAVRAQLGTTAVEHLAGSRFTALRTTATTTTINEGATFIATDNILTVASSATGFSIGDYIRIGNEILTITGFIGSDMSVTRGTFGTTPASHANGATITLQDEVLTGYIQFFDLTENVSNGSGATIDLNVVSGPQGVFNPTNKFVYNFGTGTFEYVNIIPIDGDRIVRFTQVDTSNVGNTLRFSTTVDGTNTVGATEYTTGVTVNGTAGSSGAYTQINLNIDSLTGISDLYIYSSTSPGIAGYLDIDLTPNYTTIYLYDLNGSIASTDSFVINNVTYTVASVSAGPYGYVHNSSGSSIKVSLGLGSSAFAATDTFFDSPIVPETDRVLATVSSISIINSTDYIFYDKSLPGNSTDRNTGIVIGPGQSVMVHSTDNTISYVLQGFEDITTDFSPVYYYRVTPSITN